MRLSWSWHRKYTSDQTCVYILTCIYDILLVFIFSHRKYIRIGKSQPGSPGRVAFLLSNLDETSSRYDTSSFVSSRGLCSSIPSTFSLVMGCTRVLKKNRKPVLTAFTSPFFSLVFSLHIYCERARKRERESVQRGQQRPSRLLPLSSLSVGLRDFI